MNLDACVATVAYLLRSFLWHTQPVVPDSISVKFNVPVQQLLSLMLYQLAF